jgi:hypothetical protein
MAARILDFIFIVGDRSVARSLAAYIEFYKPSLKVPGPAAGEAVISIDTGRASKVPWRSIATARGGRENRGYDENRAGRGA